MIIETKFGSGDPVFVVIEVDMCTYRFGIECKTCVGKGFTFNTHTGHRQVCESCKGSKINEHGGYHRGHLYKAVPTEVRHTEIMVWKDEYHIYVYTELRDYVDWSEYKEHLRFPEHLIFTDQAKADEHAEGCNEADYQRLVDAFNEQRGVIENGELRRMWETSRSR